MFGKQGGKEKRKENAQLSFVWFAINVYFLHLCLNEMDKVTKIYGHKSNFQTNKSQNLLPVEISLHFRSNWADTNCVRGVIWFLSFLAFFSSLIIQTMKIDSLSLPFHPLHLNPNIVLDFMFQYFYPHLQKLNQLHAITNKKEQQL